MDINNFWWELKISQTYGLDSLTSVTRVPGGWVMSNATDYGNGYVFIPYVPMEVKFDVSVAVV